MLIISKYKDYYDSSVGISGIDKTIVYDRQLKSMRRPNDFYSKIIKDHSVGWHSDFTSQFNGIIPKGEFNSYYFVIGFCGKLYPGFIFVSEQYDIENFSETKYNSKFIYDIEEARKIFDFNKKIRLRKWWRNSTRFSTNEQKFNEFIQRINDVNPIEWFRKYNTPVFAWGSPDRTNFTWKEIHKLNTEDDFFISPPLKDYSFAKVVDPFTAFQEIQMFISGILGIKESPIVGISEKDKIIQHGFDKWSFRKEPSK